MNFWRVRRLKRYLGRVWRWAKFFWKEEIEEWDHSYIFKVWAFELQQIREHLEKYDQHTDTQVHVRRILVAEKLLRRIGAEVYDYKNVFVEDLGDLSWVVTGECEHGQYTETTLGGKLLVGELDEEFVKRVRAHAKHERYLRDQDIMMLCEILKKYSGRWWS